MRQDIHSEMEKKRAQWYEKISALQKKAAALYYVEMPPEKEEKLKRKQAVLLKRLISISPDGEAALMLYTDLIKEEANQYNAIEAYQYAAAMYREFPCEQKELSIMYRIDIIHRASFERDELLPLVVSELNARYCHHIDNAMLMDYQTACEDLYGIPRKYVDHFIQLACQEIDQERNRKNYEQNAN